MHAVLIWCNVGSCRMESGVMGVAVVVHVMGVAVVVHVMGPSKCRHHRYPPTAKL